MKQINDFLSHRSRYEGTREALKTRLVHLFARLKRLPENTEDDDDLADIDLLVSGIRGTYNTHFSFFSQIGRADMMNQLNQTLSNLSVGKQNSKGKKSKKKSDREKKASDKSESNHETEEEEETDEEEEEENASKGRRSLKSLEEVNPGLNQNSLVPFMMPGSMPWMFGPAQMQMWAQMQQMFPLNQMPPTINPQCDPRVSVREKHEKRSGKKAKKSKRKSRKSSSESNESSDSESAKSSDDSLRVPRYRKHDRKPEKSRPVSDWRLKYDGSDNGQSLMKFLKEVEFYAKSENMSHKELYRSAIHLFNGAAKTWFMTGVENEDFDSWSDLKEELKKEFLSPDHDHTNESRAIARKQGPREKFQDYFLEMQKLFNSLTKPMSEKKKYDIVFRNMRSDYKGHVVSSEIDNLADLKKFGRRLDATYWYKYQTPVNESTPRQKSAKVDEIRTGAKPKNLNKYENEQEKKRQITSDEEGSSSRKGENKTHQKQDKGLQILLENYRPPKDGICFNCRLKGHHARDCDKPKHRYCLKCGFHNAETATCPYCEKNGTKTIPGGR